MRRPGSPRQPIVVGIVLTLLCLGLIFFDRSGSGLLPSGDRQVAGPGPVGRFVSRVVSPLHTAVTSGGRAVRELREDYLALVDVRGENRQLQARLVELQEKVAEADGVRAENVRLRELLDLGDKRKDLRLKAARVTARAVSDYFRVLRVTLDVTGDDVKPGMPVVAPGGLVGQVRTVAGRNAEVLLITDPRSSVDVVLETSRVRGLAVGTGEPDRYAARLEYLERSDETVVGERATTTGDDGRYPRGLAVGRVTMLKPQPHGLFQEAELEPLLDLSALEEVFIVLGPTGLTPDGTELQRDEKPAPAAASTPRSSP